MHIRVRVSRLQLEQQRATILSEGAHEEKKRLHRQVRQLTADLGAKEEEVKRVRAAERSVAHVGGEWDAGGVGLGTRGDEVERGPRG